MSASARSFAAMRFNAWPVGTRRIRNFWPTNFITSACQCSKRRVGQRINVALLRKRHGDVGGGSSPLVRSMRPMTVAVLPWRGGPHKKPPFDMKVQWSRASRAQPSRNGHGATASAWISNGVVSSSACAIHSSARNWSERSGTVELNRGGCGLCKAPAGMAGTARPGSCCSGRRVTHALHRAQSKRFANVHFGHRHISGAARRHS
mmetsp:Transcript_12735/g.34212  ORF Transcript_12735/g.34212 Transcript_12735/m.34212 type:complete len:205 (+) Transcript_12735:1618-2232(+)